MTDWATVSVVCHHGPHIDADPETQLRYAFPPDSEDTQGHIPGARLVDPRTATRLEDVSASTFRHVFEQAATEGHRPRAVHEFRCSVCPITARVSDAGLRRALKTMHRHGESEVELSSLERIVALSS